MSARRSAAAAGLPPADGAVTGRSGVGRRVGPARFFIDTNIFVYTFDESEPMRRARARELVETALTTRLGVVSYQVAQEFLNVATRKFATPLSAPDARTYLEQVLVPLWHVSPSASLYAKALEIRERSGYGFYDSLIIAGALAAGCVTLYSEDLQNGWRYQGLTVVDPFGTPAAAPA